ncbi:hypothetical protein V3C99_013159 [Haemonchus contortus]
METHAKPNFSSIARALLLKKANEDVQKTVKIEVEEEESKAERISDVPKQCQTDCQAVSDVGRRSEEVNDKCGCISLVSAHKSVRLANNCNIHTQDQSTPLRTLLAQSRRSHESRPLCDDANSVPPSTASTSHDISVCDGFYSRVRCLTAKTLSQRLHENGKSERPKYGRKGQALMIRVRMFFDELKAFLGPTCKGTLFDSPTALTAAACGVSRSTVIRIGNSLQDLDSFPRERKKGPRSRRDERLAALKNHGQKWGDIVRQHIRRKLKQKADLRMTTLHRELTTGHLGFELSKTTLYRLVRALGFSYKFDNGKRYIYERCVDKSQPDNVVSNSDSESEEDESDVVDDCDDDELMDEDGDEEPWMLESIDKTKDDDDPSCYVFRLAKSTKESVGDDGTTGD